MQRKVPTAYLKYDDKIKQVFLIFNARESFSDFMCHNV